jgi:hypothetical protein
MSRAIAYAGGAEGGVGADRSGIFSGFTGADDAGSVWIFSAGLRHGSNASEALIQDATGVVLVDDVPDTGQARGTAS